MTALWPPPPPQPSPLQHAGPAQCDWLVHFCGRPPATSSSRALPPGIASLTAEQRLDNILWEQRLLGFPPFGGSPLPAVCLSEAPLDHLRWLLTAHQFPPWGVFLSRQWLYDAGGGPVWYARRDQYAALDDEQKRWAVRLETTGGARSDWLHEREWRIPVPAEQPVLMLPPGAITAVLVGSPGWQPSPRGHYQPTGRLINGATGAETTPNDPAGIPETCWVEAPHPVWQHVEQVWWNAGAQEMVRYG